MSRPLPWWMVTTVLLCASWPVGHVGTSRVGRDLFIAALEELSVPLPAPDDREPLAYLMAADIADALTTPFEGARVIWRHCWWQMGAPYDWSVFAGAASERDDHPDDRDEYEGAIREAAATLRAQRPHQS
jgi:hypothetical protein